MKHFEVHDLKQLEIRRKVRDDRAAIINASEVGRQDLKSLLEAELSEEIKRKN